VHSPFGLLGIAFVGTFFWPISPEAGAILWTTRYGWHVALVALIAALGQAAAHVVLYLFGDQIRKRWRWFDRQCERARLRFGKRLSRNIVWLGITSGLIGLPPTSATAALAPGLGLSAVRLLPVMFVGRVVRFVVVTTVAAQLFRG
jgi:membrane protein YqaA with SNARE-associated domain